jgi:hypothetical protein
MDNQLQIIANVNVVKGSIAFEGYEELKEMALQVAEYVNSVEVTEDNVKESKKLLAKVNKSIKELEDRRIAIKKEILEPYNDFEVQVKEIVGIVKEADTKVRDQVKELEELEREAKKAQIEEIWNLRANAYTATFLTFDDFLTPQHLNKTVTLKKVEEEMTDFLERVEKDLKTMMMLPNSKEVMIEYQNCLDLNDAIAIAEMRKESEKEARRILHESDSQVFIIQLNSEKDFLFAKSLLESNKIEYTLL